MEAFGAQQLTLTVLVTVWSLRLAGFLFYRVLKVGTDSRFDKFFIEENERACTAPKYFPSGLAVFWILQWLWALIVLSPVTVTIGALAPGPNGLTGESSTSNGSVTKINNSLAISDIIFVALAIIGLLWEAIADFQKDAFKNDKSNAKKFCNVGIWSFSRQPNYFGDLLFWV